MYIIWFKRDLRIEDNIALIEAVKHGPVLPLYIFEPELWKQLDLSYRQYQFLKECLAELD
jgi:deoxyribodipyrimidine photo-lyase